MHKERKHIRLKNFDYSSEGAYFITFNVKYRLCIFGEISDEKIILSETGKIADECMRAIPQHFANAELDEYSMMPDHIHCIIFLMKDAGGINAGNRHFIPPLVKREPNLKTITDAYAEQYNKFGRPVKGSVSVIIQQFKSSVTRKCNQKQIAKIKWQSRFHDHVIRSDEEYQRIKNYIKNNPKNWKKKRNK